MMSYSFGQTPTPKYDFILNSNVSNPGMTSSAASMSPAAVAGLMVGGQFLAQMMAQKAAENMQKKESEKDIALRKGASDSQAMQSWMSSVRGTR